MNDTSRRVLGFILGAIAGLAYSLLSQYINTLYLPGVPLLAPVAGRAMTVLLVGLAGGALGMLTCWPEDAIPGVLAGTLVGTLLLSILAIWNTVPGSQQAASTLVVLFITFLPRTFLLVPFAILVRWSQSVWSGELQNPAYSVRKLALNLVLILVVSAAVGAFSLHSPAGRAALASTHALVEAGMLASDPETLPTELQPVDGFLQGSRGPYTLELTDNPDVLPIQRAITTYDEEVFGVFVRFENGYRFGCVYTPDAPAACGIY